MSSEIHVNDIGTRFIFTVKDNGEVVNISGAPMITIAFKKPSDTVIYRSGCLCSGGTDGRTYYDTVSGDLDEAGYYKVQGHIQLASGTYYTDIHTFQVHCNL
jgi:hypothetical protein